MRLQFASPFLRPLRRRCVCGWHAVPFVIHLLVFGPFLWPAEQSRATHALWLLVYALQISPSWNCPKDASTPPHTPLHYTIHRHHTGSTIVDVRKRQCRTD